MKTAMIAGLVLVVIGIVSLAYQGFTFHTEKHVADIGPIHATRSESHNVPLPPVLSGIALVGGIVLIAVGAKQ